jgi:hypothetical protein
MVFMVRRRWFKILWLRNIDPPPSPIRVGIQNIAVSTGIDLLLVIMVRMIEGFKILPKY